jgi:hypothetical protein
VSEDAEDTYDRLIDIGKEDRRELRPWVESFLDSEVDYLRAGALRTLAFYWRLPEYRGLAALRLMSDPSDEVRQVAAMSLGGYGYASYSPADMALLVQTALAADSDEVVRDAAYSAALVSSRIPRERYPMTPTIPGFEARADWRLLVEALERVHMEVPERLRALAAQAAPSAVTDG